MADLEWESPEWAWQQYCSAFGAPDCEPKRVRLHELRRSKGRVRAEYTIRWPDRINPKRLPFTIRWSERNGIRIIRFPDDPRLPGLPDIADAETALERIREYVPAVVGDTATVRVIRYRPESRAVIRHRVGADSYYARAVRRSAFLPLLEARDLVGQTRFQLPGTGGAWEGGCIVWEKRAPGRNLRDMTDAGQQPDVDALLDCIQSLWELPTLGDRPAYDLAEHHSGARRSIARTDGMDDVTYQEFERAVVGLAPFTSRWQPSGTAHNDFYDDQMVVAPDGGIAMVDYDSIGPGEPMLDIGRYLAYAKWGSVKGGGGQLAAYQTMRSAALARYGWPEPELNLREAVCLFSLCGFPATRPKQGAMLRLQQGIGMVNELLDS